MKAPLPPRDGVKPSYLWLPCERWPSLIAYLVARFPHIGEAALRARMARGEIVDDHGQPVSPDDAYRGGGRLWYFREVPVETPVPFEATVLFQNERLVVADKPHFLSSTPAGRHLKETLLWRLRTMLNLPELSPIHRLDRETAGVMMFCADPRYRGAYQQLFERRAVHKVYEAIAPWREDLDLPRIHRSRLEEGENFFTMREVPGEPNSETEISLITRLGELAHYRLVPHTGKKHQLRAHLAALGIPILNDPWYPTLSQEKGDDFSRPLQLLAREIALTDPVDGRSWRFVSARQLGV
jgi:tRNA pseudouridine32 synthase/23S rRNA pseudouridine746 synthase